MGRKFNFILVSFIITVSDFTTVAFESSQHFPRKDIERPLDIGVCVWGKQGLGFLDLPQAIAARTISEVGQWISDGIVFLFLSSACLAKCFFP